MLHCKFQRGVALVAVGFWLAAAPAMAQSTGQANGKADSTPADASSKMLPPYMKSAAANDRIPLATDTDVAWDMNLHRGQTRWDCRAIPSGKFVMNSLCADKPKVDTQWPGATTPPGWDGMVHLD